MRYSVNIWLLTSLVKPSPHWLPVWWNWGDWWSQTWGEI